MRLRLPHVFVMSALLGLSACVTPVADHIAFAPSAHDAVVSTDVVMPISQSEIYVFVPASNVGTATGGGLIGALIDASVDADRAKKSETAIKPLRDAMVDFDADSLLRDDLKASLSKIDWLHVSGVKVVKDASVLSTDKAVTESKGGAVLIVSADYHLSADGAELDVILSANMFANNAGLAALKSKDAKGTPSDIHNAIYRNTVTFKATAPGATGNRDMNIAAWSTNQGEPLRAALKEGSARVARMMASDLEGEMTAMRRDPARRGALLAFMPPSSDRAQP